MKDKILCIDDDPTIQAVVAESLKDYDVIGVYSIKEAESALSRTQFSALLVDIHLPDGDGLRYLTKLIQNESIKNTPILIFSKHSEIANKVMAFSYGADDFIAKPFDPVELKARLDAKIKKSRLDGEESHERKVADILIDFDRQKVFHTTSRGEQDLNLTAIEMKILVLFTKRLELVFSREQIMDSIWSNTYISDRTVDSHIAHLRHKIAETAVMIETVKSFGYRAVLKS